MRTLEFFCETYKVDLEGHHSNRDFAIKYFTNQAQLTYTRMLSAIDVFHGSVNFELVVGRLYRECIYYLGIVASFANDADVEWYRACLKVVEDTYSIAADPANYLDKVIKDHYAKKSSEVSALIGWLGSRGGR